MAERIIRLGDLIADDRAAIDEIVALGSRGRPDAMAIGDAARTMGGAAQEDLRAACNQDLVELLAEGWSKAKELRCYGDAAAHPPPSRATVALGAHAMEIAIDPRLTLVLEGAVRFSLGFHAVFAVTIDAAQLTIVDGAILAVDLGRLALSATLRWGEAQVPLPLRTHEIAPPGRFAVEPPFAIRC